MTKYLDFCKKCIQGEVPYQKKFYVLENRKDTSNDIKDKNLDVTIVTPTQHAVEQAKNEVRHELSINRAKKRKIDQIGGRGDVNKNTKKKKKSSNKKDKKVVIIRRKGKTEQGKVKKKPKNSSKSKVSRSFREIWM